jgi:acyl-CoA thioester hydrolase
MNHPHTTTLRVRYSETDQMGTFYNSRALEWFEVARTAYFHAAGVPYAEMEHRGLLLPLIESYVQYLGTARYDDELHLTTSASMPSRARLRFDVHITHPDGRDVARGYTVHALVNPDMKPIRPPDWFRALFAD